MDDDVLDLDRPFRRDHGLAAGLTRRQLQGKRFASIARGVLVPQSVPLDLRTRCEALGLIVADGAVFSHHTAAELYRVPIAADSQVHVSLVSAVEPRIQGVVSHRVAELGPVWTAQGQPVTSPGRTFVDLASRLDLPGLVAVGDSLLRQSGSRAHFQDALARGTKRHGIRLARHAFGLLNPAADSAPESHLRLLLTLAGFPPDRVNQPEYDSDGHKWAQPDNAYDVLLALEYEGAHHRDDQRQWERDIRRDSLYAKHRWHLIKVTKTLLYERPLDLVAEVSDVLHRRGWRARK